MLSFYFVTKKVYLIGKCLNSPHQSSPWIIDAPLLFLSLWSFQLFLPNQSSPRVADRKGQVNAIADQSHSDAWIVLNKERELNNIQLLFSDVTTHILTLAFSPVRNFLLERFTTLFQNALSILHAFGQCYSRAATVRSSFWRCLQYPRFSDATARRRSCRSMESPVKHTPDTIRFSMCL